MNNSNELSIKLNLTFVKLLQQAIRERANVTGIKREIEAITKQPAPDVKQLRKLQTLFANAIAFRTENERTISEIESFLKANKTAKNEAV